MSHYYRVFLFATARTTSVICNLVTKNPGKWKMVRNDQSKTASEGCPKKAKPSIVFQTFIFTTKANLQIRTNFTIHNMEDTTTEPQQKVTSNKPWRFPSWFCNFQIIFDAISNVSIL